MRIPTNRPPIHPGEMLLEEFLIPLDLTQRQLAKEIGVPYQRVNELINGKRGITPSTALRLSKFFGNSVGYWTSMQQAWDVYHVAQKEAVAIEKITPYKSSKKVTA